MEHRTRHLLPILAALLMAGGCADAPAPAPEAWRPIPTAVPGPTIGDGGLVCARPARNCPCEPGTAPIACHVEPLSTAGGPVCRRGTRLCIDGMWSDCRGIETYAPRGTADDGEVGGAAAALIDGPEHCDACNPACFVSRDRPQTEDLTPERAANVAYSPSAGGVTLLSGTTSRVELEDSDGDDVPDVADDFPDDPLRWNAAGDDGFFHVLPFGGPSELDPFEFSAAVRTADVYFLIDDSGSMEGEIDNLMASLTSGRLVPGCAGGVVGAIGCTIPNVAFGVGSFEEYSVDPYGHGGNTVYQHHLAITDDPASAQAAINGLVTHGNISWPESDAQALWAVATGNGLNGFVPPQESCDVGHWGYPCFRPDAIPVVVLVTDSPWHNGPNPDYDYERHRFPIGRADAPPSHEWTAGNEDPGTAHGIGSVHGEWMGFSGSTVGMANDHAECGAGGAGDAGFEFEIDEPTTVTITTEGSDFDTVLGLFQIRGEISIDFREHTIRSYSNQDGTGGRSSRHEVLDAGRTLHISGNAWKRIDVSYEVTPDTILEFDFRSTDTADEAEIHAIVIDEDNRHWNATRGFQLYGFQNWGGAYDDFWDYAPGDGWKHYRVRAGDYFTSFGHHVAFVCDDDAGGTADCFFRDLRLYEEGASAGGLGSPTCEDRTGGTAPVTLDFRDYAITSYSAEDGRGGDPTRAEVLAAGRTLHVWGNSWKKVDVHYSVTPDTLLEFDFMSPGGGEIHAIGLDEDDDPMNGRRAFQLFGTQRWSGAYHDFYDYPGAGWRRYTIPVGRFYTGDMPHLTFVCDDDRSAAGQCFFRDVTLRELSYGSQERMDVDLSPGRYYLMVGGNGEEGTYHLNIGTTIRPTWQDTVDALNARGIKVITIESSDGHSDAHGNAIALANATGSVDGTGAPYVFSIGSDGRGLSSTVVHAVQRLANHTRFDVSARVTNDPATPVDERRFVTSISAVTWRMGDCEGTSGASFLQCTPGTQTDYHVEMRNDFLPPSSVPRVFNFEIEVLLDATVQERIPVRVVVPAEASTHPEPGHYQRVHDASEACSGRQGPDWGTLEWETRTPSDSRIRIELRTAETLPGLSGPPHAVLELPPLPESGSVDTGELLVAAGAPNRRRFLRVRAVLLPSSDGSESPVLVELTQRYACVEDE